MAKKEKYKLKLKEIIKRSIFAKSPESRRIERLQLSKVRSSNIKVVTGADLTLK